MSLYLEDLHVGLRSSGGAHRLDAAQIKTFAREFDPQSFHMDEAAAENSVFEGLCASGWHTAAITTKCGRISRPSWWCFGALLRAR